MTHDAKTIRALVADRTAGGDVARSVQDIRPDQLPAGDVTVDVQWSSLNFKDALAATGHPGVAKSLPHIPGIDAAGFVSQAPPGAECPVGSPVLVTGYELGAGRWGGWCEQIRVPAGWVVPLPEGLSLREAMVLGTAGFTAAQCVRALRRHEIESGSIVVSGATGGVGCLAVMLLHKLGYHVVASTGKADAGDWLKGLGADEVISREDLRGEPSRPMLSVRYAGGIDTVGGQTLATMIRMIQPFGCVAACGVTGGHELPLTVYPFILRGVSLDGISSSLCPDPLRRQIWRDLSGAWRLALDAVTEEVTLDQLESPVQKILAGQSRGRVLVRVH